MSSLANQATYVQQIEPVVKDQGQKAKTYCYCKKESVGTTMIACDNVECETEWFHVNCLQLENIPKGKWCCPDCHKFNHGKRKKNKTVLVNMKTIYIFLATFAIQYIYIKSIKLLK